MLHDLFRLFYPRVCATCGHSLYRREKVICLSCRFKLPVTGFHHLPDNEVIRTFWGRIPLAAATSYLFFRKGTQVQQLLHGLKYRGAAWIGEYLGECMGNELAQHPVFSTVTALVPVPLHPSRQRKRGYNQSEVLAKAMGKAMQVPVYGNWLTRKTATASQTRKQRMERWNNVDSAFGIGKAPRAVPEHILLVDDVLTTGATLEACAQTLLRAYPDSRLSLVTLAYARQ